MKTILVCSQKGGVGKSMISDEIYYALQRDGYDRINFYDLDSQGGTLHETTEYENAEYAVVDTPGALQRQLGDWMKESDLIVTPTRASLRDIPPLQTTLQKAHEVCPTTPVIVVINGWNRYRAAHDFEEWLKEEYPEITIGRVSQSESFVQAALQGKSVCVYDPKGKPAQQIRELYNMIKQKLNMNQE